MAGGARVRMCACVYTAHIIRMHTHTLSVNLFRAHDKRHEKSCFGNNLRNCFSTLLNKY